MKGFIRGLLVLTAGLSACGAGTRPARAELTGRIDPVQYSLSHQTPDPSSNRQANIQVFITVTNTGLQNTVTVTSRTKLGSYTVGSGAPKNVICNGSGAVTYDSSMIYSVPAPYAGTYTIESELVERQYATNVLDAVSSSFQAP